MRLSGEIHLLRNSTFSARFLNGENLPEKKVSGRCFPNVELDNKLGTYTLRGNVPERILAWDLLLTVMETGTATKNLVYRGSFVKTTRIKKPEHKRISSG